MKPSRAALRLCHAVGLAARVKVGRWVGIDEVFALLAPADRANEADVLQAAVGADLVVVNPGPIAHSIALTAAGHHACVAAAPPTKKEHASGFPPGRKRLSHRQ